MSCLILLELFLAVAPASASYRPTPAQEKEIAKHIIQGLTAAQALKADPTILGAKSLKRELEAQMGLPLDANGDATREPTVTELNRLNGFWRDRRGDYRDSAKAVNDMVRTRDFNLNNALELSQRYYKIGLNRSAGVVRHNADSPNLGSSWNWQLRFNDGSGPDVLNDVDAWVAPRTGIVNFTEPAFSSPAMLAFNIFHEAYHYQLALADAEYGMLKYEEEVLINKSALRHVEDFGLGTDEVRFIFRLTALKHAISREERRRMAEGQSPLTPHGGFGLQPDRSETAEVLRQADADLAAFDGALARGVTDEELEAVKAGAQSEFVKDSNKSDLIELIIAWRSARENDAAQAGRDAQLRREQAEEEARARDNQIREAAAACDFDVSDEGFFTIRGYLPFRILHGGDVDTARAALLLNRACRRQGYPDAPPCNDAIGIVASRWADPRFRQAMMKIRTTDPFADGESEEGQCLLELRDHWTPCGGFGDLKATIERNYARRLAARPKPPTPQTPREPRPPRESPTPPRGDGQCYQSNDGRVICP